MASGLALLALVGLQLPNQARARRAAEFDYPESRVWPSVVRLVRVDMNSPITEKDKDTGYLLFEYHSDGKVYSGSAEVVSVGDGPMPRVRVTFQVANMPSYVEQMMLDKLERKLKHDFGPPRQAPKAPPKQEPDDDGESEPSDGTEGPDAPHG